MAATVMAPVSIVSGARQRISEPLGEAASPSQVVFSIAIGDEGVHYAGGDTPESEMWGPNSLRIGPDGSFLIADSVGGRILRYRRDGSNLSIIRVAEAVGIIDVAADGACLYALDEAASEPVIHRLSLDGSLQEKIPLSGRVSGQGVSGIRVASDGGLVAETLGGAAPTRLDAPMQASHSATNQPLTVKLPDLNDPSADHSKGMVIGSQARVTVEVTNVLGGLSVIGSGPNDDFFVLVEELSNTQTLHVDQTVRHYAADGTLLGVARVPLADRLTYVAHGVAVASDGQVYTLVTRSHSADVVRLDFKPHLPAILPEADDSTRAENAVRPQAATCSRTRDEMINAAWAYRNNRTYLTATNLNGGCSGRSKPSYLGNTAGYYDSVPYDWGGDDSVSDFNSYMARGFQAGDRWTCDSCYESCSRGVDCSGFLSRCWNIARRDTRTLPGVCTEIGFAQAQRGDILNLAGEHVVMIESLTANGVMTLESTMWLNYDRVVYLQNGWSRFNGYRFYRYNGVCDAAGQARPVVSSSLALSSAGPYSVGQTLTASFTITNRGTQTITLSQLLVGGRLNGDQGCSGGCPDFSPVYNVTLGPGQAYAYTGMRYLDRAGTYSLFVAYQKTDGTWVTSVETENGAVNARTIVVQQQSAGQARPVISSSLILSTGAPYQTGQTLYAYFTVTNRGSQSITFAQLLVGGRLNGDQGCAGGCPDFSPVYYATLQPGQSYGYSGWLNLTRTGTYSFFVAYQRTDGSWVTSVETEGGTRNSLNITVQENARPILSGQFPATVYASGYLQTIYLYGQRLSNVSAVFVGYPNGSSTYIYPPSQVFGLTYNQIGCRITFTLRGQYYLYAYTPEAGWSNAYILTVY